MTIAQILSKMIAASNGNIHDIDHLLRVWAYARTIGELEGLDAETQYLLEVAAITHDIACPLCGGASLRLRRGAWGPETPRPSWRCSPA